MMEACLAKPTDIREAYLDKASDLLQHFDANDLAEARVVYYQCAHFADKQYRQMVSSQELERLEGWVKRTQAEIEELSGNQPSHRKEDIDAIRRRIIKATKILNGDKQNLETHRQARTAFLQQAIKMYAGFLASASDEDPAVSIRLCGLWFSNFSDDRVVGDVKEALEQVGSYRFLFLAHQLTARLGGESTLKSAAILLKLVLQMCTDHPYHCVYQVCATRSTVPRSGSTGSLKRTRASIEPPQVNESQARRGDAARSIMAKLREGKRNKERIAAMEEHFQVSLEWAQHPVKEMVRGANSKDKKDKKDEFPIPRGVRLRDLVWVGQEHGTQCPAPHPIPVSTAQISVDYSKRYDNFPRLHYYKLQFSVAGGVSLPKINVCVDDQGSTHKQLVGIHRFNLFVPDLCIVQGRGGR
jgi:ataxia telangiectasia mutated family protein